MLDLNRTPWRVLLGLFLMTLCTGSVLVAEAPQLAAAQLGGTVVSWQPQVQYDQLTLRIDGPAGTFTRVFDEGEVPFFDLASLDGPIDGSYTFELTASPRLVPEVRQTLQAARERGEDLGLERKLRAEGLLPAEPLIQSGYLRVVGGQFVSPDRDEPILDGGTLQPRTAGGDGVSSTGGDSVRNLSAADQVILDDLIVDGSICVGFDCVNGENFGFDTLRLKENNVRIKFDDTSNSASFPNFDWQLTANDSTNGGANKFSIDDITSGRIPFTIEGSAPSNSLYVDDGGRVGLGTSTPVVELHVVDGDTPTLRLEQDGSSGFTPQTWDVAGNEAGFFVRDVTNGSALAFRILPGASSESLVIDGNDDVGMGAGTNPSASLHVKRSEAKLQVERTNSGNAEILTLINDGPIDFLLDRTDIADRDWRFEAENTGFFISRVGSGVAEFELANNGDLSITGDLTTGGTGACSSGCDLVFHEPETRVESIEEHAAQMWANKHLPAVGPTKEGQPFNLTQKTGGMLNELEKAHIYIEQLNEQLKEKGEALVELRERNDELSTRLAAVEAALRER